MNTLLSLFLLFLNHSLHQDVYYQITQFVYEHLEEMFISPMILLLCKKY